MKLILQQRIAPTSELKGLRDNKVQLMKPLALR